MTDAARLDNDWYAPAKHGSAMARSGEERTDQVRSVADPKPNDFTQAMRCVASTVFVLTTALDNRRFGLTATSVCSLSADPPSLLACVSRTAEAHDAIIASRRICINALREDQRTIAARFSGAYGDKGERRFADADWYALATGAPVLRDAAAVFDCDIFEARQYKTHSVLTCLLKAVDFGPAVRPLLYAHRQYASVSTDPG